MEIGTVWAISSAGFYDEGSMHENGLLWRRKTHYAKYMLWIVVDGPACSHSEFNLSTQRAHLRKPPFANLLWLRSGLLCCLKETYKCCKFSATH